MPPEEGSRTVVGRRERKKLEVAERLRRAAFEVFSEKGFEDAKLRDISERADIAERTLFNYVTDKRDLLAFVLAEELSAVSGRMFPPEAWELPVIDQLKAGFEDYVALFSRYAPVSLMLFREAIWFNTTPQLKTYLDSRTALLERIRALVEYKQGKGEIRADTTSFDAAWVLLSIFMSNVRRWLLANPAEQPTRIAEIEPQFSIILRGLSPE
ncbi:helix-turn-helix domain containing protein [Sphingomonas sp. AOB5]|uniref:TetR/AcrR family transcriptional regulator n=1 Tax=Sphingomonas sp. AOB5 TaxID=3034017 RepID=UPI0023F8BEBA|nr:helix-turn-helix domain-containing protein [Sphingomonas sp. AOB5]MDF7777851.1 helix-turn-helix domain containing protein [Sphingomonas sp. AOB5]